MQEQRYDNTEILTANAQAKDILEAINNPENKTVAIHKPGAEFVAKDGTRYIVGAQGNLIRKQPKRKFLPPQPSSHARKRAAKKSNTQ